MNFKISAYKIKKFHVERRNQEQLSKKSMKINGKSMVALEKINKKEKLINV